MSYERGGSLAKGIHFASLAMHRKNQGLGRRKTWSQNARMKIGYARVSTIDQNPQSQADALKAAGCDKIIIEKVSGASSTRPQLDKLLPSLAAGDVLVVVRLDRLGHSRGGRR